MNILILTGQFGLGHVKAAEAIRESILAADSQIRCSIVDFTEFLFPRSSVHIYKGFHFLVNRCSRLYNCCNRLADRYGQAPLQAALLYKIDRLVDSYQPDLVIATLPFCGQYISRWKSARSSSLPLYTYITDVTLHEEWISEGTDRYFVAAERTRTALRSRGVSPGKITVSGVPVRQRFLTARSGMTPQKTAASTLRTSRPIHVLIMGGGLGMISCDSHLLCQLHDNPRILTTVITGKNVQLAHQLREKYPKFRTLGYTEDVHRYMKEADLLITKPGGITTFEAIACRTPLFLLPPTLEQENLNAQFVIENGIGCMLTPGGEILRGLTENRQLLDNMRRKMSKLVESYEETCPLNYFTNQAG